MAFRFAKTRGGDSRGVAGRWLRAFFLEDWTLKLLALLITLGLWYAVTTQRAPATMRLRAVQLEFILPDGVDIGNEPVGEVDVTLEGSQGKLAELNARNLVARADVTGLRPGDRVARLTDNIKMDLPEGVRIIEVSPRTRSRRSTPRSRCASRSPRGSRSATSRTSPCARPPAGRSRPRPPPRSRSAARARSSKAYAPRTCGSSSRPRPTAPPRRASCSRPRPPAASNSSPRVRPSSPSTGESEYAGPSRKPRT